MLQPLRPTAQMITLAEVAVPMNPAEEASERALAEVLGCLDRGESFLLEAGAGAGKTYSLVKALQYLIERDQHKLPRRHQKIACITFTNVAKDEIEARTDRSSLIYCDTIHAFCWSLISGFQRQLRDRLTQMEYWPDKIAEHGDLGEGIIEYTLGHRSIKEGRVSIHHDDVLLLTVSLMESPKFRRIIKDRYPIILIDEYQDTNAGWIDSIKHHFLGQDSSPQFGFFGDHWQKIYGDGCGRIEHASLPTIGKQANFRSVSTIVDCLNRIRPEFPQFVANPDEQGSVNIFHSNTWNGARQTRNHWQGDLPDEVADHALQLVTERLTQNGWDLTSGETKILMLTHRVLASKQGYSSLPVVFAFNESFTKKENSHIAFFADTLEPACEAYLARKYGEMFLALDSKLPAIRSQVDKKRWSIAMERLIELRHIGTVGDVIDHLQQVRRPRLPDLVERRERELEQFDRESGEDMSRALKELEALRAVRYQEIVALTRYLSGHSPFETKHGVKGAEFENVLIVVGRGWNQYNFNDMLEMAGDVSHIPANRQEAFERNRNLFYVACSRPKKRLGILFTQRLSNDAMEMVSAWFGNESIEALAI
jgi:DNA helicase-2/ATP-dependent DNA helicase PcrA